MKNAIALTGQSCKIGTDVEVVVGIYDIRPNVYFIMEMGAGGQSRISDISDDIPLLNPLSDLYSERKHVGVTGKKSMTVPDDDVIAKSIPVKPHKYYLPVGGGHYRVALAEC